MGTIIIWDSCGEEAICFYDVEGDYSHLDGVYVNGSAPEGCTDEEYDKKCDELMLLTKDYRPLKEFPLQIVDKERTKVIVAGFIP